LGPVSSIYAKLSTRVNDIEVEDCAALSLEMSNGALVTSSITLGAAEDVSRIKICFSNLTVSQLAHLINPIIQLMMSGNF
jgi:hypothetical protein